MKCNHKYVNMEDGTRDKFCVRCSKKAKQAALYINHEVDIKIDIDSNKIVEEEIIKQISKDLMQSTRNMR